MHILNVKNYQIIRKDKNDPGEVGLAIFIAKHLKFSEIPINGLNSLQALGIKLHLQNGKFLNLAAIYNPRSQNAQNFRNDFNILTATLQEDPFVIGGDFNARHTLWGNTVSNTMGNALYNW